jgi:hypothetical protein
VAGDRHLPAFCLRQDASRGDGNHRHAPDATGKAASQLREGDLERTAVRAKTRWIVMNRRVTREPGVTGNRLEKAVAARVQPGAVLAAVLGGVMALMT